MKTIGFNLLFMFFIEIVMAQDYQINFIASGSSYSIDSINVENLNQRISLTLDGDDILHLSGTYGKILHPVNDREMNIYPNPMIESSTIEFYNPGQSLVMITINDENGKIILTDEFLSNQGIVKLTLSYLSSGVYTVTLNSPYLHTSSKLVSISSYKDQSQAKIKVIYNYVTKPIPLKSQNNLIPMQYNDGEILLFKSYSGKYICYYVLIATQNQTINFEFLECSDFDENNYPVIAIGTQTWMGENLKTTHFNNGITIPNVIDNYTWKTITTGAYCWPENDSGYKDKYGALYNCYTVNDTNNLCPIGWHVPSDAEWNILTSFLGSWNTGGKLKSTRADPFYEHPRWDSPNMDATNESGFSGLPAGYRYYDDGLMGVGFLGLWWSSTCENNIANWTLKLMFSGGDLEKGLWTMNNGLSVRCLKD